MKRMAGMLVVALWATTAQGQGGTIDPQCRAGTTQERATQDACQKALDLFTYLAPQLGAAIAGGNAVSGEHSALSGPGRFSIGFRANAIRSRLPRVDDVTPVITGARASAYAVKDQLVPVPTVDAAVGLFRGFPVGGTYALGIDGLVNVAYLPSLDTDEVKVTLQDGSFKLGFGARVALVQESNLSPGISVSYLQRDLPAVDVLATPGDDRIAVNDFQVSTKAWRAVIGKNLKFVSVAAGVGQDTYETSARSDVSVVRAGVTYAAGPVTSIQTLKRDNAFGSVSLNLSLLSIVGEYGRSSHGRLTTYNTFGATRADDAVEYLSVGVRIRR